MRRLLLWTCILLLFFIEKNTLALPKPPVRESAILLEVIDGDTVRIRFYGRKEAVRLIGIDSPELHSGNKAKKDAKRKKTDLENILSMGKKSQEHLQSLVRKGELVFLEFDVERRDKYKRLLAYVFLSNGSMLNELMLRDGYASPYTVPPNVRFEKLFRAVTRASRNQEKGLWNNKE